MDACRGALVRLGPQKADLAIVFASAQYDQEKVLSGVHEAAGDVLIVGSSTAGEITTEGPLARHSVAVMLLASDTVRFFAAVDAHVAADARAAGRSVGSQIKAVAGEELKAVLMFPDVLAGNGADIVRGVGDALGPHFPVVGGASGDDFRFEKTFQYLGERAYSGAVVALGLAGRFSMGIGVKHGWVPIGMPLVATRSQGAVLHELDHRPAISIYEDYFGPEETRRLREERLGRLAITYPLGMRVEGSDEMLIRDALSVDEHGSITCAAEIPEGAEIQLMVGSRENAIKVAQEAAEHALAQLEGRAPKAIIVFNCIARSKLFGERSGEEIAAIQSVLGRAVPLIGFYTYGEQAPLGGEVRNIERCNPAFHNETVVICAFAE